MTFKMSSPHIQQKTKKKFTEENLEELSKQDLLNKIKQQEKHVIQLQNILAKSEARNAGVKNPKRAKAKRKEFNDRPLDFSKYNTRHVALKISYLGWDYLGYANQEDSSKTIESALFSALLKTKLIESRETSCYHRCGRTDRGVSAFCQVVSIDLRTNLLEGVGIKVKENGTSASRAGDKTKELPYLKMLNGILPEEIRVLAWAPVDADFSARFSCEQRTYKYFFPQGNLDVAKMNCAAQKLVGSHDFRNYCKMDVGNGVVSFTRNINQATVETIDNSPDGYQMCELTVVGKAFLWHQIRCIVAVLYLVGEGKEDLDIIDVLFDVENNPRKPQYTMAWELPLVLFHCVFPNLDWIYEQESHEHNINDMQSLWSEHRIKSTILKRMLDEMTDITKQMSSSEGSDVTPVRSQAVPLLPDSRRKRHIPLMKRQLGETLEDRIKHYVKRQRLEWKSDDKDDGADGEHSGADGDDKGSEEISDSLTT